jgi:integrase
MPLSREEVASILAACDVYPDKLNAVRLRALILLLRYSGLRIRDAVTLSRERISDSRLFLYTAKTGTAVYCPLPPFVTSALEAIPKIGNYFFWTGESKPKSAVEDWQRSLKRLFELARVPTALPHRLSDTFSVELLQAGVPIERVSVLLGHRSVRIYGEALKMLGLVLGRSKPKPMLGERGVRSYRQRRVRTSYAKKSRSLTD